MKKIVIIGAGPTGLGAAYRLKELGYKNFTVYERNSYAGGLCASFKDKKGFTWDLGGHVVFSRYNYFNSLYKSMLKGDYLEHRRKAWIRTLDSWIPYPFQSNLRYLPKNVAVKCLSGLKKAGRIKKKSSNFEEWIIDNMGAGIAEYFMFPYNFKVWAYPLRMLSFDWIAERVSQVDIKEIASDDIDKAGWGPNAVFRFPISGGTGEVFRRIATLLKSRIIYKAEVCGLNPRLKKIYFPNAREETYDILINTSPMDKFVKLIQGCHKDLLNAVLDLKHNGVFVVGLGIKKQIASNKCWIYFPDKNCPFFRATYFSNYSPYNVPDNSKYYSLLCETSYSEYKKENKSEILEKTVQGLIDSGLLKKADRKFIVSNFLFDIDYAYPIPTLSRNKALRAIQPELQKMDIYSRGRFGAWKYEAGNTDHSIMQGKEVVDRILKKRKESIWRL